MGFKFRSRMSPKNKISLLWNGADEAKTTIKYENQFVAEKTPQSIPAIWMTYM